MHFVMGTSCLELSRCHPHENLVNKLIVAQFQRVCLRDVRRLSKSSTSSLTFTLETACGPHSWSWTVTFSFLRFSEGLLFPANRSQRCMPLFNSYLAGSAGAASATPGGPLSARASCPPSQSCPVWAGRIATRRVTPASSVRSSEEVCWPPSLIRLGWPGLAPLCPTSPTRPAEPS
jgi:hypothetical protein